jgi:hypothetical protein
MSGTASAIIDKGSALGVKPATKSTMQKTQIRQGRKIALPLRKPIKLKVIKKTGSSKAIPNNSIALITKSR